MGVKGSYVPLSEELGLLIFAMLVDLYEINEEQDYARTQSQKTALSGSVLEANWNRQHRRARQDNDSKWDNSGQR